MTSSRHDVTVGAKETWLAALAAAQGFVRARPQEEYGCLYYSTRRREFVVPASEASIEEQGIVPHFGRPGGVVPRVADDRIEEGE